MKSIMYGESKSNDLEKYCAYQKCQKNVEYNKLKTGMNDPSISCRMRQAQYIRQGRLTKCCG